MHDQDSHACFQAHLGLWAIDPLWLQGAVRALQRGLWPTRALPGSLRLHALSIAEESFEHFTALSSQVERRENALFSQVEGTALTRIVGPMAKMPGKFVGTSTVLTRRAIREALASEDIEDLLVAVDSPGGMVAGTMELAEELRRASTLKPVGAFYEDLAASAAVWATAFAQRISATPVTQVGSVGVVAEVIDASGAAEREGITVHVVSTGPFKGLGAPGTPVTPELLEEVSAIVHGIGAQFFAAVQAGRRLTRQQMAAVTTGELWLAPKALELGLVDAIETFDQALDGMKKLRPRRRRAETSAREATLAALRARLAEVSE